VKFNKDLQSTSATSGEVGAADATNVAIQAGGAWGSPALKKCLTAAEGPPDGTSYGPLNPESVVKLCRCMLASARCGPLAARPTIQTLALVHKDRHRLRTRLIGSHICDGHAQGVCHGHAINLQLKKVFMGGLSM